ESGREDDPAGGTRDRDEAVLERLAQRLQRRALELGELVEEQHTAMRQARLAGPEVRAAADNGGGGGAVGRRATRRPRDGRPLAVHEPGDGVDPRDLERGGGV